MGAGEKATFKQRNGFANERTLSKRHRIALAPPPIHILQQIGDRTHVKAHRAQLALHERRESLTEELQGVTDALAVAHRHRCSPP